MASDAKGSDKYLTQYDERNPDKSGISLDEHGQYDVQKIAKLERIKAKLGRNSKAIQLNTQQVVASEYYTPEEMQKKFAVPKVRKRKKKKKSR